MGAQRMGFERPLVTASVQSADKDGGVVNRKFRVIVDTDGLQGSLQCLFDSAETDRRRQTELEKKLEELARAVRTVSARCAACERDIGDLVLSTATRPAAGSHNSQVPSPPSFADVEAMQKLLDEIAGPSEAAAPRALTRPASPPAPGAGQAPGSASTASKAPLGDGS